MQTHPAASDQAPLPLNRHDVPEGFVSGHDSRLRRRATVALTSMGALFMLTAFAALSVVTLAANGLLGPTGAWLFPVVAVVAIVTGAGIAQFAWPRIGRGTWARPLSLGVFAGGGVLGTGVLLTGLLAS